MKAKPSWPFIFQIPEYIRLECRLSLSLCGLMNPILYSFSSRPIKIQERDTNTGYFVTNSSADLDRTLYGTLTSWFAYIHAMFCFHFCFCFCFVLLFLFCFVLLCLFFLFVCLFVVVLFVLLFLLLLFFFVVFFLFFFLGGGA